MKKLRKLILAAASAASVLPVLAQEGEDPGLQFVSGAVDTIQSYNTPIIALLSACFAIVMIFVGYKIAKRSVSKA